TDSFTINSYASSGDDHKARGTLLGQPSKRIELISTANKRAFHVLPFVAAVGTRISPNRENVDLVIG
ncbi:MAG: hypothetical protein KAY24_17795, partial [Candidatus Eisenbacteria sp.]|nr:hypothetical protein [Candidatus Eisenbacteria bacterium]